MSGTRKAGLPRLQKPVTGSRGPAPGGRGTVAAAGAKPRPNPLLSVAALGAGAYLAWRGAEGSCPLKAMIDDERAGSRGMIEPG